MQVDFPLNFQTEICILPAQDSKNLNAIAPQEQKFLTAFLIMLIAFVENLVSSLHSGT